MAYSNINQYVFPNLYPKLENETYDMSLTSDELDFNQEVIFSPFLIAETYGNKLPIYFDINFSGSVQQQTLEYGVYNPTNIFVSLNYYNPKNENLNCFSSSTLCDVGLTGIDNGLVSGMTGQSITFTKGLLSDSDKFHRLSYDRRMKMFQVTGYTIQNNLFSGFNKNVIYEVVTKFDPYGGYYHELYGGFYQGFYKLFGFDYETFPERVNKGWTVEMLLRPRLTNEFTPTSAQTTLNQIYPQNKNTFFYFGARAENKFYHHADGSPRCYSAYTRVTSGLTECIETCSCCNYNITNSRCIYVYPPRSLNNIHDPHVNYGCPLCSGTTQSQTISCGCDCSNYTCKTCGWECFIHTCQSIIELTPTPTPTPSATPTFCEPSTPVCTTSCTTCEDSCSTCYNCTSTEFTSVENTCETDPIFDSMSNNMSFRLSGQSNEYKICVKVLKFTGDCVTTGTCPTTGYSYSTGYTISEYCTSKTIFNFCEIEDPYYLSQEHWFQVDVVWERYSYFDDCDLRYRGGLNDITETPYLESLANNTTALITIPYTQVNGKTKEKIELVELNQQWLDNKKYRKGKLKIYVNGLLFETFEDFEEIIPRGLNTDKEKQIGVPFNISWGGGTQGLRENLTFSSCTSLDGPYIQDPECLPNSDLSGTTLSGLSTNILLEKTFAGTFDGGISQFRMYVEPLTADEIKHNFKLLKNYFNMFNPDCPDCSILPCETDDFTYNIIPTPSPTTTITPSITPTTTLTPTVSSTITPTPSITPSITPTISLTPSITPTISLTPSVTPTISLTPSVTLTKTPTPTCS